jgi:hypothetical protein
MDSDWPEPGPAPGGSLAALLARRGALTPGEVVTVIAPLAQALAAAHDCGRGHGAITADAVEFTAEGRPLLTDAGLARRLELDPAGDVAALADVGWLALTGGAGDAEVAAPGALVDALRRAMSADPGERPDAAVLAELVLRACPAEPVQLSLGAAGQGPVSRPVGAAVTRQPRRRRASRRRGHRPCHGGRARQQLGAARESPCSGVAAAPCIDPGSVADAAAGDLQAGPSGVVAPGRDVAGASPGPGLSDRRPGLARLAL